MDVNGLRFLVEIIESGSLSAAARRLDTTRSNVSRRLKTLERQWRVQLLRRTTRRVEPTQIGAALCEHAKRITGELDALQGTLDSLGKTLRGHVRVSVPTGLGQLVLGPLLLDFAKLHPEVTLEVTLSNRVVDLVAQEVDVACRIAVTPPQDCVARELARIDWVLCGTPEYLAEHGVPKRPSDLVSHSVLTTPTTAQRLTMTIESRTQRHQIEVVPRIQCADFLFLHRAIASGLGIGALPRYIANEGLEAGTLRALLPGYRFDVERLGDRLYLITLPNFELVSDPRRASAHRVLAATPARQRSAAQAAVGERAGALAKWLEKRAIPRPFELRATEDSEDFTRCDVVNQVAGLPALPTPRR